MSVRHNYQDKSVAGSLKCSICLENKSKNKIKSDGFKYICENCEQ